MKTLLSVLCVLLAVAVMASLPSTAIANAWRQHLSDGSVAELDVADSIVCIKFASGVPLPGAATFAQERPELVDDYSIWNLSESFKVFGVGPGQDIDTVIASLRGLPEVGIATPVFHRGGARAFMTDVVMVSFKSEVTEAQIDSLNDELGVVDASANPDGPLQWTVHVAQWSRTDPLEVANAYRESGMCYFAQPDFVHELAFLGVPNDSLFGEQWHWLNSGQTGGKSGADVDATLAWDVGIDYNLNNPVRVALLESGFWVDHEDTVFTGHVLEYDQVGPDYERPVPDYDARPGCTDYLRRCWHGTSMLGVLAATTNNSLGVAGMAPQVQFVAVKITDDNGFSSDSLLAQALRAVWINPSISSQVLVLAWSTAVFQQDTVDAALRSLREDGHVIFCAAGNDYNMYFPATSQYVYAVGATNDSDVVQTLGARSEWWSSAVGDSLDFVAPGVRINSWDLMGTAGWIPYREDCDGHYNYNCAFSGTSPATAVMAGTAALVLARRTDLWFKANEAENVSYVLRGSSEDQIGDQYDSQGWDMYYGHGRVNAYRALLSVVRGDMDNDAEYTALDLGWMSDYLFAGGPPPVLDDCVVDMDCDGFGTALDMGVLIDILYASQPPPAPCFVY